MQLTIDCLQQKAKQQEASNKIFFQKLRKKKPANLDTIMQQLHDEVFNETDCIECGNCCKSLGPRLTDKDIEKMAKNLRIKPSEVVTNYLRIDEDKDYVFKQMPCPFILTDNYCTIYTDRPKACREYPHTDRKRFYQLLEITLKNTFVCPAVFEIVERLKNKFPV